MWRRWLLAAASMKKEKSRNPEFQIQIMDFIIHHEHDQETPRFLILFLDLVTGLFE
jgi:hypothetical protein